MLIWGFNFVAMKLLYLEVPSLPAAIMRWILMTSTLYIAARVLKVSLKIPEGMALRVHLQGFLSMGLYMALFVKGMETTGAAEGAILLGTGPIFTLILAVLFKQETFKWSILLGTLVAFLGVSVVIGFSPDAQHGTQSLIGPALLVTSALVWAFGTVVSRPLLTEMDPMALTVWAMPAGGAVLILLGWKEVLAVDWGHLSPLSWGMMIYFGLLAGFLGFWLFYRGVSQVGAAGAMLYQYFVAPLAAIFGFVFLHRGLNLIQFVGLLIVIVGVTFATSARQSNGSRSPGTNSVA